MPFLMGTPEFRAFDNDGNPLAGGKLYLYEAGTSTPKAAYADADGDATLAYPIILDAQGRAPFIYFDGSYKLVLNDASDAEVWSADNLETPVTDIGTVVASEWTAATYDPTYINATQFSVAGDKRSDLHVGRRVCLTTVTYGQAYGTITVSAYTTVTTVTVVWDTGSQIDNTLNALAISFVSSNPSSIAPEFSAGLLRNQDAASWRTSLGLRETSAHADNLGADTPPAVTDDIATYDVGSLWQDTTSGSDVYELLDPAAGAAVWTYKPKIIKPTADDLTYLRCLLADGSWSQSPMKLQTTLDLSSTVEYTDAALAAAKHIRIELYNIIPAAGNNRNIRMQWHKAGVLQTGGTDYAWNYGTLGGTQTYNSSEAIRFCQDLIPGPDYPRYTACAVIDIINRGVIVDCWWICRYASTDNITRVDMGGARNRGFDGPINGVRFLIYNGTNLDVTQFAEGTADIYISREP